MSRTVLFLLVAVLIAVPAFAAAGYSFDIRVTDGRTALLSNPDYAKLGISPEQLERAAKERVVVLDGAKDAHWRWLMLSWFDADPVVEQTINDRGAGQADPDFALASGSAGHFRLRCLRDECAIALTHGEQESTVTLKRKELSPDLPLDSRLALTFR